MSLPEAGESIAKNAEAGARQAAQEAKPWVERLARLGYRADGVIYGVVGWLALLAALDQGGKTTSASGALASIATQPFGKVLLIVVAVGLVGHALWLFVRALADPQHKGTDAKGIAKRVGYAISGLVHSGLALTAFQIIRGGAGDAGGQTQDLTARLLSLPLGRFLVVAVGLALIGVGIHTLYTALKEKFRDTLQWSQMDAAEQQWGTRLGKAGLCAKAVVSGIIGGFLIQAGLTANANEARGLDGALKVLAQQPYGPWLLGIVAVGLFLYGVYSFAIEARYRRVFER